MVWRRRIFKTSRRIKKKLEEASFERYYDLHDKGDRILIENSLLEQYGIDLTKEVIFTETYFNRLSTIGPDTSLGRIVSIRAEKDKERIKKFTTYEKRIYNEWHNKQKPKNISEEEYYSRNMGFLDRLKNLSKQ